MSNGVQLDLNTRVSIAPWSFFVMSANVCMRRTSLSNGRGSARANEHAALLEISQTLASTLELQPESILEQLGGAHQIPQRRFFTLEDSTLVAERSAETKSWKSPAPIRIRLDGKEVLQSCSMVTTQSALRIFGEAITPTAFFLKRY